MKAGSKKFEAGKSELAKREEEILKFWRENKIFEKSLAKPAPRGEFVFYEGPPTANGRPGIHHLGARAFKDLIPRFKTMRGYRVPRRAGWDTHGLPVELEVEKTLGLKSKKDIENYGLARFNAKCRESVGQYLEDWRRFTDRIGFWLDQEQPYFTYQPEYMESVWWVVKQAARHGLLYKDYKVVPWCPRCGTALSSHELAQGYEEVTDPSVYVKFKVKNPEKHDLPANTFLLVWTTTPWTLPGNVALAVGEGIDYVLVENGEDYLITADFLASGSARPLAKQVPASRLIGLEYEPLFDFPRLQNEESHRVYSADFVSTAEGTGIVHTAVMYGADDFELGVRVGLPRHHLVGEDGKFMAGTPWAGKFVKDADQEIIAHLKQRGRLFRQESIKHTYPFCWRCKTPLIYYARDSWYLKMSARREKLLAENQKINWIPAHIRDGRFGEWLAEAKDWAISRERYWGTPLPVWQSADGKEKLVIGSIEELKTHTKRSGNRYFVMRHGEAEHNVLGLINSSDTELYPLTKLGRDQVHSAAASLRGEEIVRIYTSPFLRTRESAEIIADELGLARGQILIDDRLREFNFGQLDGHPFTDFLDYESKKMSSYNDSAPAGESYLEAKRRFGNFIYELEANLAGEAILIVTHGIGPEVFEAIRRGAEKIESKKIIDTLEPPVAQPRELDFIPLPHNADYELDLHRPFIDELELVSESGQALKRVPEVLDVWLDSGAMPFAQNHYPVNQDLPYPADFIAEAIDQTRGWFYTLLAVGVLLDRGRAYKNVICLGHLLDREGKKMSKSLGNALDPWLMIDQFGADALRFWMYLVNQPGDSKNFGEAGVNEVVKKVINPLVNVASFYRLYGAKDQTAHGLVPSKHVLDQWLVELLAELISRLTDDLEHYRVTAAARSLRDFIGDLSQWYVRRSRNRFRAGAGDSQIEATATLRLTLAGLSRLLAPFMPFLAEQIYQIVRWPDGPVSVHLTDWPEAAAGLKNKKLLDEMIEVRRLVSLALEARLRAGVKVRQPLAKLILRGSGGLSNNLVDLLKDEVNVQAVVWQANLTEALMFDLAITDELRAEGEWRELLRQIQDLRKRTGLRSGELAVLRVSSRHAARELIETRLAVLRQAANLAKVEFDDSLDVPFSLSY